MSYDDLKINFEAFKMIISETLPRTTAYHLGSDEYSTQFIKQRLVNYVITATQLKEAIHAFRTRDRSKIGLLTAIAEKEITDNVSNAIESFVNAVKMQLEALDAVERMVRADRLVNEALSEFLEKVPIN
ncbi:uncharacterized protein N0V89_009511 [Didymosphaeria variabile]|uniref:Uncharacterized protein n=1 Tax=Didymosphaeria variabile TaxID=1932322 RepID=A0A9W8XEG9_9PLEO|nr:uncharacterized protein N0V89_009511 [Didymosphaeria variabile]KAJ4348139.1 hypothetical protein N0V89_009511 [Didymosphaeria variabile]